MLTQYSVYRSVHRVLRGCAALLVVSVGALSGVADVWAETITVSSSSGSTGASQKASAHCGCGSWTCPTCQKGCNCPSCTKDKEPGPPEALGEPQMEPGALPEDMGPEEAFDQGPAPSELAVAAVEPNFGAIAGDYGAVPNMIGDFFGGGSSTSYLARTYYFSAYGDILSGNPGDPNASIGYRLSDAGSYVFFSVGAGTDTLPPSPDADTFNTSEPVPPGTGIPHEPGYTFANGLATNPTGTFYYGELWDIAYTETTPIVIPSSAGSVVGRMKIAENVSPLPRDRVFFNYSLFGNVPLSQGGGNVNRFSPGFEKTFFNRMTSVELRAPFAATLNSDVTVGGAGGIRQHRIR